MAPPVITITRQYASGGSEVARLVAAELGWDVIDNEFVDEVARRAGLPPDAVAREVRGRAPGGEPGGGGEGRRRNRPAARPVRADLLRAASPRRGELRPGGEHGEAGTRGGGGAGGRRSASEEMGLRTSPPRSAALAACLSLACWHGPTPAPLEPVAVVPFAAYGGAIYVPAGINGDSAWLMFATR